MKTTDTTSQTPGHLAPGLLFLFTARQDDDLSPSDQGDIGNILVYTEAENGKRRITLLWQSGKESDPVSIKVSIGSNEVCEFVRKRALLSQSKGISISSIDGDISTLSILTIIPVPGDNASILEFQRKFYGELRYSKRMVLRQDELEKLFSVMMNMITHDLHPATPLRNRQESI